MVKSEYQANGQHRREMQALEAADRRTLINGVTRNDTLGLVFSWLFAMTAIGIGAYFVYIGREAGALLGVLGLLPPIIGAFRIRRSAKTQA